MTTASSTPDQDGNIYQSSENQLTTNSETNNNNNNDNSNSNSHINNNNKTNANKDSGTDEHNTTIPHLSILQSSGGNNDHYLSMGESSLKRRLSSGAHTGLSPRYDPPLMSNTKQQQTMMSYHHASPSPIGGHISKPSSRFADALSYGGVDNGLLSGLGSGLGSLLHNSPQQQQQQQHIGHHNHHSLFASPSKHDQFLSPLHTPPTGVSPSTSPSKNNSTFMLHSDNNNRDAEEDELESLNRSISNVLLDGYDDEDDREVDTSSPASNDSSNNAFQGAISSIQHNPLTHNGDATWDEDFIGGMDEFDDLQDFYGSVSSFMQSSANGNSPFMQLASQQQANSIAAAAAAAFVEHPLGEHPSRTLFVRNISSHVDDVELKELFESYGAIRSMYTQCKHRGFVMISYYDIRHAKNAMKHLQHKIIKRRKIDIHYSIPKENPSEKDLNQGTLVVFNLDAAISNEELNSVFGSYGEIKEIRETPNKKHHKFIEFYDVRDADRAMKCLNKTDLKGKKIKIEPSRPGGARRNLMYQWQFDSMSPTGATTPSNGSASSSSPDSLMFGSQYAMDELSNSSPMGLLSHQQILNENTLFASPTSVPPSSNIPSVPHQQLNNNGLNTSNANSHNNNMNTGGGGNNNNNSMYSGSHNLQQQNMYSATNGSTKNVHQQMNNLMFLQSQQMHYQHQMGMQLPMFAPQMQQHQSPLQNHMGYQSGWNNIPIHSSISSQQLHMQQQQQQQQSLMFPPDPSMLQNSMRLISPRIMDNGMESTPKVMLSSQRNSLDAMNHHDTSSMGYGPGMMHSVGTGLTPNGSGYNVVNGNPYANIPSKSRSHSSASMHALHPSQNGMHERMRSRNRAVSAEDRKKFFLDLDKVRFGIDKRTTLMVKNIPNKYTQKMLLQTIDQDFRGKYDFFYLPIDFKNKCNVGYAFINFVDPMTIIPFCQTFHGKKWEKFNSEKVCDTTYARIQGKQALINHFQNSSLMCEDPSCRPVFGPAFFQSDQHNV